MTFTIQENAKIWSEYHQGSRTLTQGWVNPVLKSPPPHRSNVIQWERLYLKTGNTGHKGGNGKAEQM